MSVRLSARLARLAAALALAVAAPSHAAGDAPVDAGPYVPSPQSVVTDMLTLARVGPQDFVIDLGSGDGRIVLTAAKVFGASGFGVDINEKLVREANDSAKRLGVAERARFMAQDLFKTDISRATVLTMYLLPDTVNMLRDKLLAELQPGTRILSHDYPLAGWPYEEMRQFDLDEKVLITNTKLTLIFLYVVPARAAGAWTAKLPAQLSAAPVRLELQQKITRLAGSARIGGRDVLLDDASMHGEKISFLLPLKGRTYAFSGAVRAGAIEGTVKGAGLEATWSAVAAK